MTDSKPGFTSTSPLLPILHLLIQSSSKNQYIITKCIKFARNVFMTEKLVLLKFKYGLLKPFHNKNNNINKQCKKSNLEIVQFLEALETFIHGDKQM